VVLHGHGDTRAGALGHTRFFLQHGYNVLAPDNRGHGASDGMVTFGVYEAEDLRRWAAWLSEQTGAGCVFALGESMGAAVVIQAAAERSRLCAAVAESSFSSFRRVARLRVAQQFGAGEGLGAAFVPVVETACLYTRLRYGVDLTHASPDQAAPRLTIPVLLIHGAADANIPPEHSRRIQTASGGKLELWEVPSGGHTDALSRAPEEFTRRVLQFFDRAGLANP
jgi:pimeloyl-ACP methyl ester carboxylesterase